MPKFFTSRRAPRALDAAAVVVACAGAFGCTAASSEETGTTRAELVIAKPSADNNQFGTFIVSDPQTLVVGDPQTLQPGPGGHPATRGSVHAYNRNGSDWVPFPRLDPDGPKLSEIHLGERLALSGNLLFASAHRDGLVDNASFEEQGSIFAYARTAAGQPFTFLRKITTPAPILGERFGSYTATNGSFLAAADDVNGGNNGVYVYSIQGTSFTFLYNLPMNKPYDLAMTQSGVLMVLQSAPDNVLGFRLTQSQAIPIDTSAIPRLDPAQYREVRAGATSVALLNPNGGGQILLAQVDASRVTSVSTTNNIGLGANTIESIHYLDGQRIVLSQNDNVRPSVFVYQPSGQGYALAGSVYPPLESRLRTAVTSSGRGNLFGGGGLTSSTDFLAVGEPATEGRVYVLPVEPTGRLDGAVFESQQLLPHDACGAQCGSQFFLDVYGRLSAIGGDLSAVTGGPFLSPNLGPSSVHVYARQAAGGWVHAAQLFLEDKLPRSLELDSQRLFVGQGHFAGPNGFTNGSVRVFENVGGTWQPTGLMLASDDGSPDSTLLGETIAIDGNVAAAGSFRSVYLFQRNANGSWSQTEKKPLDSSIQGTTPFAATVALSPNYLVAGARRDGQVRPDQGSVFVYRRNDWQLEQKILPTLSLDGGLQFGSAVAIDGTTLAIGYRGALVGGVDVYERTGSGSEPWQKVAALTPYNAFDYGVGPVLSLSGDQLLIGASADPLTGTQAGAVYLVKRVGGTWDMKNAHVLLPSDYATAGGATFGALFGGAVPGAIALSGDRAIIGAANASTGDGPFTGSAYVFEGLVDADSDGLLVGEDCDDHDGIAIRCAAGLTSMSFEQTAGQLWTATTGTATYTTARHSDGRFALQVGAGTARLRSPTVSTKLLHEIGTTLSLDVFRQTASNDAITLFMSAPNLGVNESVIGTINTAALPTGRWVTIAAPLPTSLRNILLHQNTGVSFTIFTNLGGPQLFFDRLHFSGKFEPRTFVIPPGALTASLTVTSDWGTGYCASLFLSNSSQTATAGWRVGVDTNSSVISSSWNAAFSGTAGVVTIASNQTWNASIAAGAINQDVSVGFCANRNAGTHGLPSVLSANAL